MRKIAAVLLAVCLVLSPAGAFAQEYDLVKTLGIMTGHADGSFAGEDVLSRAQFAKIAVVMTDRYYIPFGSVSPYSDVPYTHWGAPYIAHATDLGLLSGYPDGSFRPEREVTYEEVCKVLLAVLGYQTTPGGDWAGAQVHTANQVGILKGLQPVIGKSVTRNEVAQMTENTLLTKKKGDVKYFIENLGYAYHQNAILITDSTSVENEVLTTAGEFKKNGKISTADMLKSGDLIIDEYNNILSFRPKVQKVKSYIIKTMLTDKIAVYDVEEQIKIEDDTKSFMGERQSTYIGIKNELKMGDRITVYRDASGKSEYISVDKDVIQGPVTNLGGSYQKEFGIPQGKQVKVFRDGIAVEPAQLEDYDVCYYIEEGSTILAYTKKKTGIYENALPNKDHPTSVMLSGVSYEIGSLTAFHKLSSDGGLMFGDTITVLLDKDGKIADVMLQNTTKEQAAVLVGTGMKERTYESGEASYQHYVRLATIDSGELEYIADKDYSDYRGKAVTVSISAGKATLSTLAPAGKVYGSFSWANRQLGNDAIASDIRILDAAPFDITREGKYKAVFPQRLDGVIISANDVLYAQKNARGIITGLILSNVTSDFYSYGMITKAENKSSYIPSGQYDALVGSDQKSLATINVSFNVFNGQPALFDFDGIQVKNIKALAVLEGEVVNVDSTHVYIGNQKYKLSDQATIYRKISNSDFAYEVITLSQLRAAKYNITAYWDKPQEQGGLIRVLVAKN